MYRLLPLLRRRNRIGNSLVRLGRTAPDCRVSAAQPEPTDMVRSPRRLRPVRRCGASTDNYSPDSSEGKAMGLVRDA